MEKEANWIVYCTVNNITKEFYIGIHKTTNKFDGYLGSGVYIDQPYSYKYSKTLLQCAVNKYGSKNFTRYTLAECYNEYEAMLIVNSIITLKFLRRFDVYNTSLLDIDFYIPLSLYSIEGNYIQTFDNIKVLSEYLNTSISDIYFASVDGYCILKKYYVSFIQDTSYDKARTKYIKNRPVSSYNLNTKKSTYYKTQSEAMRKNKKLNINKLIKFKKTDSLNNIWQPIKEIV